jgi:hypothetical protein
LFSLCEPAASRIFCKFHDSLSIENTHVFTASFPFALCELASKIFGKVSNLTRTKSQSFSLKRQRTKPHCEPLASRTFRKFKDFGPLFNTSSLLKKEKGSPQRDHQSEARNFRGLSKKL